MLLRFKLTPTVFDLDDDALQEKVDLITAHWPQIGDRDLCELMFSDFDPRIKSEWDRERYVKVQGMHRRQATVGDREYDRATDSNGMQDEVQDVIRRNQQEFSR